MLSVRGLVSCRLPGAVLIVPAGCPSGETPSPVTAPLASEWPLELALERSVPTQSVVREFI